MQYPQRRQFAFLCAILVLVAVLTTPLSQTILAQSEAVLGISTPEDGTVLRGTVAIRGVVDVPLFSSAVLVFGYDQNPTDTWFEVVQISTPVIDDELASWDTTLITDGSYVLRLIVFTTDGRSEFTDINVEIRNYTSPRAIAATSTPTRQAELQVQTPVVAGATMTPVRAGRQAPTALGPNTVAVTGAAVQTEFLRGGLAVFLSGLLLSVLLIRRRR